MSDDLNNGKYVKFPESNGASGEATGVGVAPTEP